MPSYHHSIHTVTSPTQNITMTKNVSQSDFTSHFQKLTGNPPLRWQERLFRDHLAKNDIPPVIDVPTGLGKTMVMAIWLIARADQPALPRRLIYVVDRRTVVDQATILAIKIQKRIQALHRLARRGPELELCCKSFPIPAVSTLRGQLADNRVWTRDPSRPAIIIGTVDLIGSALLFSGYRSSYKRRPLEAGMIGQDSLLVLDEAHLSKPFEELLVGREHKDGIPEKNGIEQFQAGQGTPMQVIRMSATSGDSSEAKSSFTLLLDEDGNLKGEDAKDEITCARLGAKKQLTIRTLGEKDDLNKKLVEAAIELALSTDLIGNRQSLWRQ